MTTLDERGLPASVDAERSVLGAILLDAVAYHEASEKLRADDFALDSHRRIFKSMSQLDRDKRAIDIVTLSAELGRQKQVEAVGGIAYLASLTEGLPRRPSIAEYVRIVREKSMLRQVIGVCSTAITRAADQSEDAQALLSESIRDLEDVMLADAADNDLESVGQYLANNDIFAERKPGIMTGFRQYDELTYGLHPGELTIVAGRTSMGKTAWAGSLTLNLGRRNMPVLPFVNEQRKESFLGRMLCGHSKVGLKRYRQRDMSAIERHYIQQAVDEIKMLPIFWDFRTQMSVASIRAKAMRLKRSEGLDECVIVIDQLSGVTGDGIYRNGMQKAELVGEKVRALKNVASDLGVPLILMHQLNRETTKNKEARPDLENLRDSGNCEEHADNVLFLHRPDYYDKDAPKGEAEMILRKQRDGETGIRKCKYEAECCSWSDE